MSLAVVTPVYETSLGRDFDPLAHTSFGRLVALFRSNEHLLAELESLRGKLSAARSYLNSPSCHATLGQARLLQLRTKRRGLLAQLRANRLQAAELVGRVDEPRSSRAG